ncbi:MAG: SBBP repeat-containing protein, partial [Abditibacteriales bacterium]|nr:SBBP repeat-containing protein [Abditibacteriales bacterium]
GSGLVYCGYIGGAGFDKGHGIAVDGAGNAYVMGYTSSHETTFPETVGPDLTFNGGFSDTFVAKVRADGRGLVYCGYIGGADLDEGYGIAVDGAGNAYVTGSTVSNENTFPETVGPDLTFNGGFRDAFVAKVRADGSGLVYCGYIGGAGEDRGYGIAVDGAGNACVTGETSSNQTTFPVTDGPDLTFNGLRDAFVAKVRADGRGLVYCGYIGGAGSDQGHGIAVDGAGNAYVTGEVRSGEATFPVTVGPDLTFNDRDDGEFNDAFVAKVSGGVTCADDVTGRVRITRGDFRYKRRIQRYVQTVTLTNISGSDIPGPVSLVLDNLSSNAELFQPDGHTSCTSPADSPYKNVNVGGDNALKPGKRAKVTLEFINPSHRGITYTARVLAGAGER